MNSSEVEKIQTENYKNYLYEMAENDLTDNKVSQQKLIKYYCERYPVAWSNIQEEFKQTNFTAAGANRGLNPWFIVSAVLGIYILFKK